MGNIKKAFVPPDFKVAFNLVGEINIHDTQMLTKI